MEIFRTIFSFMKYHDGKVDPKKLNLRSFDFFDCAFDIHSSPNSSGEFSKMKYLILTNHDLSN